MKGAGVEPRLLAPQAGMITTTLPASRLLKPENCKTIKPYPYYFIRALPSRLTEALSRLTGVKESTVVDERTRNDTKTGVNSKLQWMKEQGMILKPE